MKGRSCFGAKTAVAAVFALLAIPAGTRSACAAVISYTVDPVATLSADGTRVTTTGTLVGTPGDTARISVSVLQVQGRLLVFANGTAGPILCDGSVQNWAVTGSVGANSPGLKNGPANARVSIETYAPDPMSGELHFDGSVFANVRVSLHRR
jgi:Family of unknown function (DUF6299)